jgi:hypothetical protein
MKKTDIENLKMKEFINLLSEENYNYIQDHYSDFQRALELYQEGAKADTDGEDTYLDVNEYFELTKEQNDLLREYQE